MKPMSSSALKIKKGMDQRKRRTLYVCLILSALLVYLIYLNITWGNTRYTIMEVLQAAFGLGSKNAVYAIQTLRMPRILAGLLAGCAFGLAGAALQRLLGNPLASPDIIGVSMGSSTAAVFAMLTLGLSGWPVSVLAVIAGCLITLLIYVLAHGNGYSNARLILIGIGMQAFMSALISWQLQLASEFNVGKAMRWITGSLNDVQWTSIPFLAVSVVLAAVLLLMMERHLQILQLGEAFSVSLGSKPDKSRMLILLGIVALCSFASAVTGPIAAVAFLAGPIASRLCKNGSAPLIAAALCGAVLVLASDWIGQFVLPARYPVGIVTGLLGAPYLLILLMQLSKKKG